MKNICQSINVLKLLKSVTAQEKYFQWQVQQEMLPVGSRLHRPGAEKMLSLNFGDP